MSNAINWNGEFDEAGYQAWLDGAASDPICRLCATQEHGSPPLSETCICGEKAPMSAERRLEEIFMEASIMSPKKDEYMRGYGDGFKDGRESVEPALRNLAHEMRFLLRQNPEKDGGLYRQRLDEADAAISKATAIPSPADERRQP